MAQAEADGAEATAAPADPEDPEATAEAAAAEPEAEDEATEGADGSVGFGDFGWEFGNLEVILDHFGSFWIILDHLAKLEVCLGAPESNHNIPPCGHVGQKILGEMLLAITLNLFYGYLMSAKLLPSHSKT